MAKLLPRRPRTDRVVELLGSQPLDNPLSIFVQTVPDAVVKAARPPLPEFEAHRRDAVAAAVLGAEGAAVGVLGVQSADLFDQLLSTEMSWLCGEASALSWLPLGRWAKYSAARSRPIFETCP